MRVAGLLHRGMEGRGVRRSSLALLGQHRRQIRAAAEPALRGRQEASIHVHGRHPRATRMHDQADAGGDVVELHAVARQRLGHLGRQLAVGRGGVNTDLLEQPAAAEKTAGAAAAAGAARPGLVGEGRGRPGKQRQPALRAPAASTSAQIWSRNDFEPDFGLVHAAVRQGRVICAGVGVGHYLLLAQ